MLVKPMRKGVTCTVLMDCCHSGTVLDLPYKFGADDKVATEEEGFNMEVVRKPVRPPKVTEEMIQDARKRRREAKRAKAKEEARRAAEAAQDEADAHILGPKVAPNGQPVLPTRPTQGVVKRKDEQAPMSQAPAPPPATCQCIVQ